MVLPARVINLPASQPPGPFDEVGGDLMVFPFASPKVFTGPHLFIEHVNSSSPGASSNYWTDGLDNRSVTPHGHNAVRGRFGCGRTGATPTMLRAPAAASANGLGGSTVYSLSMATPLSAAKVG